MVTQLQMLASAYMQSGQRGETTYGIFPLYTVKDSDNAGWELSHAITCPAASHDADQLHLCRADGHYQRFVEGMGNHINRSSAPAGLQLLSHSLLYKS